MRLPDSDEARARREAQVTAHFAHKPRNAHERKLLNQAIRYRIARGDIIKTPCADAHLGECNGVLEGHHEDYAKPWDLVWLCTRHHARRHAAERSR